VQRDLTGLGLISSSFRFTRVARAKGQHSRTRPSTGVSAVFQQRTMSPAPRSGSLMVLTTRLPGATSTKLCASGVEPVFFAGVGACEAWHEGFMPWLLELPALRGLRLGTQKTVRWPGYAAKVTVLKEMGLLSLEPVMAEGVAVATKKLLDALLYPRVRLEEGERDITVFRVEAVGEKEGRPRRYRVGMVDRYDISRGRHPFLTSARKKWIGHRAALRVTA